MHRKQLPVTASGLLSGATLSAACCESGLVLLPDPLSLLLPLRLPHAGGAADCVWCSGGECSQPLEPCCAWTHLQRAQDVHGEWVEQGWLTKTQVLVRSVGNA